MLVARRVQVYFGIYTVYSFVIYIHSVPLRLTRSNRTTYIQGPGTVLSQDGLLASFCGSAKQIDSSIVVDSSIKSKPPMPKKGASTVYIELFMSFDPRSLEQTRTQLKSILYVSIYIVYGPGLALKNM